MILLLVIFPTSVFNAATVPLDQQKSRQKINIARLHITHQDPPSLGHHVHEKILVIG